MSNSCATSHVLHLKVEILKTLHAYIKNQFVILNDIHNIYKMFWRLLNKLEYAVAKSIYMTTIKIYHSVSNMFYGL